MKIKLLQSLVISLFILIYTDNLFAQQTKNNTEDKAFKILDKAIGEVFSSESIGITFEGLAFGISKPEDIFTLPVYKVYRGGHLYLDKNKYQIELGLIKSISDGKLMVVVDEQSKTMIVDSVRTTNSDSTKAAIDTEMEAFLKDDFTDGNLQYEGIVNINNHSCHKIRSLITNNTGNTHVIYWVDTVTGQLYLMGEFQNSAYNVYWINKVGKAPVKFEYNIFLPAETLTTYHGYKVVDQRFPD